MTIIAFLVDTSASMNQRALQGGRPTLIDVAKGAVENFVKIRSKYPDCRLDRYMLFTFEDPPFNIKVPDKLDNSRALHFIRDSRIRAGWKESLNTFMNELKSLQPNSLTTAGSSLKQVFDLLNINRMQSGIDTYGMGRSPWFLEPSFIVVITDGGKLSNLNSVQDDFSLPMSNPIPGSELTREPFRWDQRLFALVLRMTGTPAVERDPSVTIVPSDTSSIDAMCDVTGGRSYCVTSQKMLSQCLESLVAKVANGVVIHFEKVGPDPHPIPSVDGVRNDIDSMHEGDAADALDLPVRFPSRPQTPTAGNSNSNNSWHSCRRLIHVPRSINKNNFILGHWPIPESFWPDANLSQLPPRSAQPNVKFTCVPHDPMVVENVPFDKYELEPSPLTQYILSRRQPNVCWQVFVPNSGKPNEVAHPFGYLKASSNLMQVNLFIMPYNYPVLLTLLDDFNKVHQKKPPQDWRNAFNNYMRATPFYYYAFLRRGLSRVLGPMLNILLPDNPDPGLNYTVTTHLKRVKNQAKLDHDKLCADVVAAKKTIITDGIKVQVRPTSKRDIVSHPLLQDKFNHLRDQMADYTNFVIATSASRTVRCLSYRNPFDIPRKSLLDQVVRMRSNYNKPPNTGYSLINDEDEAHSMPVGNMGNYQEYLKKIPPMLRELESAPVRQHMFGNPFKLDKRVMVDEADVEPMNAASGSRKRSAPDSSPAMPRSGRLRKPGPLPRDFVLRRPSTPLHSPASSPRPSSPPLFPGLPILPSAPPSPLPEPELVIVLHDSKPIMNGTADHLERPRSPSPELPMIVEAPPPVSQAAVSIPSVPIVNTNHMAVAPTVPKHPNDIPLRLEPRLAAPAVVLTEEVLEANIKHNKDLMRVISKEVKRPGKDFSKLMDCVKSVKGGQKERNKVVNEAIKEALRFKRKTLALTLQSMLAPGVNGQAPS